MNVRRGDVVLLDQPFSDGSGSKIRPVVIVQSDSRNERLNCTVVASITRNLARSQHDPTQVLIDVSTLDGAESGLNADSVIACGNLFTVHQDLLDRKIGELTGRLMSQVAEALLSALELV